MKRDFTEASDTVLVVSIGRWSEEALAEAYRRHAGSSHALALRVMGDPGGAEEVVQEVFLKLWNEPEKFDPDRGTLRSYLLTMTHGRAVDRLRSDISRRRREESDSRRTATSGYDIEHEVWDLTVGEHLQSAVAELPEIERRAIALAYFGGQTYREVAETLGEPEGTVKSRIRSGLKKMQSSLAEAGLVGEM